MKRRYIVISDRFLFLFVILSLCSFLGFSCRKALELDPPISGLASQTVYANNSSAAAAVTSIYDRMSNTGLSDGQASISLEAGLSADELTNYNVSDPVLPGIYSNSLSSLNKYFWTELYQDIYGANAAIQGLTTSTSLSDTIKQQLLGEAEFMRAFLHLYAVNLYGDVPLVTTTDYRVNNIIQRTPISQVYQQIISDLKDAQNKLSNNFLTPKGIATTARVRPNKGAATALLARTYLYLGKYDSAEAQATAVINNTGMYRLYDNLDSVFLKNSNEAIWQLQSVVPGTNTYDAYVFVLTSPPGSSSFPVAISNNLYNAFEPGDARLNHWVGVLTDGTVSYYYPNKYKVYLQNMPVTEYTMVLRLAEQYLIRAEARAQQSNIGGAIADLNVIRERAGLTDTTTTDKNSLLTAIAHERQVELFTEWGHRWFDLKRTGMVNSVMSVVTPQKNGIWNSNWSLYPIPASEILINPNLKQNPGYQ